MSPWELGASIVAIAFGLYGLRPQRQRCQHMHWSAPITLPSSTGETPMRRWNLDPRQAGVTEPDVETIAPLPESKRQRFNDRLWIAEPRDRAVPVTYGATEAAALHAARIAAGYGHVAEQPCARFVHEPDTGRCEHDGDCGDCFDCAWPFERHGKGER